MVPVGKLSGILYYIGIEDTDSKQIGSSDVMSKVKFLFIAFIMATLAIVGNTKLMGGELSNLSGNWSGNWQSEISGHQGALKAKFTVMDETKVQARFSGRFFKVVPFKFNVTLDVVSQKDGVTKLQGKQDLGRALGIYHYDVTYKGDEFIANYKTDKDKGVFTVSKK